MSMKIKMWFLKVEEGEDYSVEIDSNSPDAMDKMIEILQERLDKEVLVGIEKQ